MKNKGNDSITTMRKTTIRQKDMIAPRETSVSGGDPKWRTLTHKDALLGPSEYDELGNGRRFAAQERQVQDVEVDALH